jgi:hypothetical protein
VTTATPGIRDHPVARARESCALAYAGFDRVKMMMRRVPGGTTTSRRLVAGLSTMSDVTTIAR